MFRALWLEIKRFLEALFGKISFDAWINSIMEFAQETIKEKEKSEKVYENGFCIVSYTPGQDILAKIQLLFDCPDGSREEVTAERSFPEEKFLSESLDYMRERGKIEIPVVHGNS